MKTLVIFHRSDLDGLCCEAIARKALGTENVDYLGFEYGDDVPNLGSYSTVYLLDISLPEDVMADNRSKIIWIDHHKSAIKKMRPYNISGYQIDGVAACRLAWQYFFEWFASSGDVLADKDMFVNRRVEEPYAVQLLGEYDIWDKRNPYTDLFQFGMNSVKDPSWGCLLSITPRAKEYVESIVQKGKVIDQYVKVTSAQIITERGFDFEWEGLKWRALNIARCNSMTFLAALKPEHDACLAYFWNGRHWKFSFYHAPGKEHHDLSKIASKYGGGGHAGACGCQMDKLPVGLGS